MLPLPPVCFTMRKVCSGSYTVRLSVKQNTLLLCPPCILYCCLPDFLRLFFQNWHFVAALLWRAYLLNGQKIVDLWIVVPTCSFKVTVVLVAASVINALTAQPFSLGGWLCLARFAAVPKPLSLIVLELKPALNIFVPELSAVPIRSGCMM